MSEETKKSGWFSLKGICTGVVCAAIGAGASIGIIDLNKVQDTITAAQARQIVVAAALYTAENAANEALTTVKAGDMSLAEKAKVVIKAANTAVANAKDAADTIIKGVITDATNGGATKENVEAVKEAAKEVVTETKDKVAAKKEATKTEAATPTTK